MPSLSSGSLSGEFIEPETSSRKTRLLGGALVALDLLALQADANEPVPFLPWAAGHFNVGGEGDVAFRPGVVVIEVIDQFLDADGVRGGSRPSLRRNRRTLA